MLNLPLDTEKMRFSAFGDKFSGRSGILQLMDDLGKAMSSPKAPLMLGGGNPAFIPEVQSRIRARMQAMLANGDEFERLIGNYETPQGNPAFIEALCTLLRTHYGWGIAPPNVAITAGSQASFFLLFNMFAGRFRDGQKKKILLPMAPEYIGYTDLGLTEELFTARRPEIEYLAPHRFKYHVDFEHIDLSPEVGAICFSRPTNPTGNVLTDQEVTRLMALAQARQIPLIIDNAYGSPFPNIVFTAATPLWDEHTIVCLSLSKLGLPGARTGIVIAPEPVAQAIAGMTAIFNLAPSSLGALLTLELVKSGEIIRLSQEVVKPYYRGKAEQALGWLDIALEGLDYFVHHPEGAMFLWLWLRGLPIKSEQLYERLRRRGVVVVSGHYFFPGLEQDWRPRRECIRISYAQAPETVQQGIAVIGEEARKAYREG